MPALILTLKLALLSAKGVIIFLFVPKIVSRLPSVLGPNGINTINPFLETSSSGPYNRRGLFGDGC